MQGSAKKEPAAAQAVPARKDSDYSGEPEQGLPVQGRQA